LKAFGSFLLFSPFAVKEQKGNGSQTMHILLSLVFWIITYKHKISVVGRAIKRFPQRKISELTIYLNKTNTIYNYLVHLDLDEDRICCSGKGE